MRSTTPSLAAAITARQRTLTAPRLLVDWDADGYGDVGTLDDLSAHVVDASVDGALQSDLPDEVRLVQGNVARTLTATLGGGSAAGVNTATFFSPVAPNSTDVPLGGLERRNRPCSLAMGFVTSAGTEWVPVFAGRTTNLPVQGTRVQLTATDNRALLRQQLDLPALPAQYVDPPTGVLIGAGLEATWVVSYILARNGIYASPPPRPGTRVWAPMHGSSQPVIHNELNGLTTTAYMVDAETGVPCRFVTGPFLTALSSGLAGGPDYAYVEGRSSPTGTALYDTFGRSKGRIEAWVSIPPEALATSFPLVVLSIEGEAGLSFRTTSPELDVVIGNVTVGIVTGPAVNAIYDGEQHVVGLWWDRAAGTFWVYLDGTLAAGTFTASPATGTSPGEDWGFYLEADAGSTIAEVHITAGTDAGDPWIDEIDWTLGAFIDRSDNQLVGALPDSTATDSWELLKAVAEAERGAVFFDADGVCHYRTPTALAGGPAQNVQATLTSLTNITALSIEPDASRVRNSVQVPWTQVVVHAASPDHAYDAGTVLAVPPGQTFTQVVTLKGPTVGRSLGITMQVNTKLDGTGTSTGPVTATPSSDTTCGTVRATLEMVTATTCRVSLTNTSTAWRYLCDTTGAAAFGILGVYLAADTTVAAATATDADSIAAYGVQSVSLSGSTWRQSAGWAAGIAAQTLADTANPAPQITNLQVVADPRIEYYDRVAIADPTGTLLDGTYWVKAVTLTRSGSSFLMTVACTATRDIALFDTDPGFDVGVWS